jgi:hypothetical protein
MLSTGYGDKSATPPSIPLGKQPGSAVFAAERRREKLPIPHRTTVSSYIEIDAKLERGQSPVVMARPKVAGKRDRQVVPLFCATNA